LNEKSWTKQICNILNEEFTNKKMNLHAETLKKLPYEKTLYSFNQNWKANYSKEINYETDLFIYEIKNNLIIPRIVIEAKFKNITTHDAITYNFKAKEHKNIIPFLRYGIMIGNNKEKTLSWKIFNHGENFDFMYSFKKQSPDSSERKEFLEIIYNEIKYSKEYETIIQSRGKKSGIHLFEKSLKIK